MRNPVGIVGDLLRNLQLMVVEMTRMRSAIANLERMGAELDAAVATMNTNTERVAHMLDALETANTTTRHTPRTT